MSEVEKLKRERKAERMSDPHAWAYEIEKRADQRSITGAIAFLICLALAANVWLLWKERDRLLDRVSHLEQASRADVPLPPEGYRLTPE
jgi:uncharacterized protein HemX